MRSTTFTLLVAGALAALIHVTDPLAAREAPPLAFTSARVSIEGSSNLHDYSASTTSVRLDAIELAAVPSADLLAYVLQPGAVRSFTVTIPAATLTSPRDGIDKNMHKALKVEQHPDIRFRLRALEPAGPGAESGAYRAAGLLTIAGVERDVALDVVITRQDAGLAVAATANLLMTDFGISPPRAMLGLLRTSPDVQVRIDALIGPS